MKFRITNNLDMLNNYFKILLYKFHKNYHKEDINYHLNIHYYYRKMCRFSMLYDINLMQNIDSMSNNLILNLQYMLNMNYHMDYILYQQRIRLNHMKQCM